MRKILVLFAHPKLEQSKANLALINAIKDLEGVTFRDLYELYPDFNIHVNEEKKILALHDIIVWHHPFYWYSCPPLLKQWIDLVLEYNWAYGPNGRALWDKTCFNVITTGGSKELYCSSGSNHYSVAEFLRPFEQTAILCGMDYLSPFTVMGTHRVEAIDLNAYAEKYRALLEEMMRASDLAYFKTTNFLSEITLPNQ